MEPAEEPVLRYLWRSVPWGWRIFGALVLFGLAAWGVSGIVEGRRRARLQDEIRAFLAALPPVPPEPVVADDDNAAPALLEAMAAVRLGPHRALFDGVTMGKAPLLDPQTLSCLKENEEAIRLLEVALGKPGFSPGPPPPPSTGPGPADPWDLLILIQARAVVALQAERVEEAVATSLLVPRMTRRIGPGRAPPWIFIWAYGSSRHLDVLETAVADPRLGQSAAEAILRDLPPGEEARAAAVADFEAFSIRDLGRRFVEFLGDDAQGKARAAGWRPPSLHERLFVAIGKGRLPPGVEPWPTVGQFREIWNSSTGHWNFVGLRGKEAVRRFGPVPLELSNAIYVRDRDASFANALRTEMGTEARLEVIRAAAALRLFEMRNGRAPASLAELTPALLPAGTRDPYTEGPLPFKDDGEGWEVSSAGPGPEWASAFPARPVIRWKRPAPLPQDGGK